MRQSGYALLLSLFAMLGIGGFWFVSNSTMHNTLAGDQTAELGRARQALISYAVNYIDHYGVQGAGIGHLPCPDTDSPDQSHSDPWVRDGPNPPCGREPVQHGWLPRHVSTNTGRYHFHTRSRQRLWYAVSGQYVNNPLSRVVNPETNGNISIGGFNDIVAVITAPSLDATKTNSYAWWNDDKAESIHASYTIIRTKDIKLPAMQRVVDWLLVRLNAALIVRCNSENTSSECSYGAHARAVCSMPRQLVLVHWLSKKTAEQNCELQKQALLTEFSTLEDVPYARHWFIRNSWPAFIDIEIEASCIEPAAPLCEFASTPIGLFDRKLVLNLQPISMQKKS